MKNSVFLNHILSAYSKFDLVRKGALSRLTSSFCLSMTGTRPHSLWNLRNWCLWTAKSGKIAALSPSNMSPKHYITRYKQQNWTLKNCWANKFSKTTIAVCLNLLQICTSVLSFLFVMSFIPSFNVLSGYFDGSLNLVAVPIVWVLINFLIQLL